MLHPRSLPWSVLLSKAPKCQPQAGRGYDERGSFYLAQEVGVPAPFAPTFWRASPFCTPVQEAPLAGWVLSYKSHETVACAPCEKARWHSSNTLSCWRYSGVGHFRDTLGHSEDSGVGHSRQNLGTRETLGLVAPGTLELGRDTLGEEFRAALLTLCAGR